MGLLTQAQLRELILDLRDRPVLSVYLEGSTDPGNHQWRAQLQHELDVARDEAHLDHAGTVEFERARGLLLERLGGKTNGLGSPGWLAFVGPTEVYYANGCPVALPTLAVWGEGIQVAPYIRALAASRSALVVMTDARRTEIFMYRDGQLSSLEEVRAHHAGDKPVHLGHAPRRGFHTGTRGGTGRDRLQRGLQEGTARMQREAIEVITHHAAAVEAVIVAGTPQHRRELGNRLSFLEPERVYEIDSIDVHATHAQIAAAVATGCSFLWQRRIATEVDGLFDEAGSRGAAVLGFDAVRWALDRTRVETLYVTPQFIDERPVESEAAVRSALAQRAEIELVDDGGAARLDEQEGVAAKLRYRLVR